MIDAASAPPSSESVCLVVHPFGDGATWPALVRQQTAAGQRVHALICRETEDAAAAAQARHALEAAGAAVTDLAELRLPAPCRAPAYTATYLELSDRVRYGVQVLHARHRFRRIEFADRRGAGFCAVQARRAGIAFLDVPLAVRLHGPSAWQRERDHSWMESPDDLRLDYCERYAFEHADEQLCTEPALWEAVQRLGWRAGLRPPAISRAAAQPLVTAAVAHYNLGAYLPETLAALAAQTYRNLEVLVIDDGSPAADSQAVFAAMEKHYPQFRFLRQANAGPGAARNRLLAEARGEFFVSVDADNLPRPTMVAAFVEGMRRNPHLAAMTCHLLAFRETADIAAEKFLYRYLPTGGPHVTASFENIYGDNNAIFRTEALRAAGGFETDRSTPWEDWETFVKLVNAGGQVGVIPEPLFYYRCRDEGRLLAMTRGWTDTYRLNQRLLQRFYLPRQPLTDDERATLWNLLVSFKFGYARWVQEQWQLRQAHWHLEQANRQLAAERDWEREANARLRQQLAEAASQVDALSRERAALAERLGRLRHRVADGIHRRVQALPPVHRLALLGRRAYQLLRRRAG